MFVTKSKLKAAIETTRQKMLEAIATDPAITSSKTMTPCVFFHHDEHKNQFHVGWRFCRKDQKPGDTQSYDNGTANPGTAILVHVWQEPYAPEEEQMIADAMGYKSVEQMNDYGLKYERERAASTYMSMKLAHKPNVIVVEDVCLPI